MLKNKKFFAALFGSLSLFLAGCAGLTEHCTDSDISVKQLEERMAAAIDPGKRYIAAKNFVQRYELKQEQGLFEPPEEKMVEVKFAQPGNFKITTFDEGEKENGYIFNMTGGYSVDYSRKRVRPLDSGMLSHLQLMQEIANPVVKLSAVFNDVRIQRCTSEGKEYYKLTCRRNGSAPLCFYVDSNDYLLRKLEGKIVLGNMVIRYSSRIISYALNEGLMVAAETESEANGIKSRNKLVDFKLNALMGKDEFSVPAF